MPLPSDFTPWEHLQNVVLTSYNRDVRRAFRDAPDDNLENPRSSLKLACLARDDDSAIMTAIRMNLFYFTLRRARDLQATMVGIPKSTFDQSVVYHPQIRFYFSQPRETVKQGDLPDDGEFSFRLMNVTEATINESLARKYAVKIKSLFVSGGKGIEWHKGSTEYSYHDKELGYRLGLNCIGKGEAQEMITRILQVQSHKPEWEKLTVHDPGKRSENTAKRKLVYGKQVKQPRFRPETKIRFRYAELIIRSLNKPITLVDLTGRRIPLVRI